MKLLRPFVSKKTKDIEENAEVVILLRGNNIDKGIKRPVLMALYSSTEILGHIKRRAIASEEDFLIEAYRGKIDLNRAIFLFLEDAHLKAFHDLTASELICLALVIELIEGDAHVPVALIESFKSPAVHLLPESPHILITVFPELKHLLSLGIGIDE